MNMEKAKLNKLFEEEVNSLGYLLIDVVIRGDNHLRIIELYIDNEKGITTDDCVYVSREINELIEKEKIFESNYRLDVSSPGIDRPLKYLIQYQKHLNRKFEIQYKIDDKEKKLTGKLSRIEADNLYFIEKNNEVKINFNNIIKAKVLISF